MAAPLNDNVRKKILDGTARLLEQRPFAEISLKDIAEETGVSKGAVYYYYKEKGDILFDVTDRCMDALYEELNDWFIDYAENVNMASLSGYVLQRGIFDESSKLQVQLLAEATANQAIAQKIQRLYRQFYDVLTQKIAECAPGIDAAYYAKTLLLTHDALLLQGRFGSDFFDIPAFIAQFSTEMGKLQPGGEAKWAFSF